MAETARSIGARLVEAAAGSDVSWTLDAGGRTHLRLRTPAAEYGPLVLALRGAHQVDNAVVAVRLLEEVRLPPPRGAQTGRDAPAPAVRVPRDAIEDGLRHASWPGRLDLRAVAGGRSVLLDAAHNPSGAASLASYLRLSGLAPLPVVFGVMRDKAGAAMLAALAPVASRFVFTQAATARARPAAELLAVAAAAGLDVPCEVCPTPTEALEVAWRHAPRICVCGSIFLVGDVLASLAEAPGGPGIAAFHAQARSLVAGRTLAELSAGDRAIIAALDSHTAMSSQALSSPSKQDGILDVLFGQAKLYQELRARARPLNSWTAPTG